MTLSYIKHFFMLWLIAASFVYGQETQIMDDIIYRVKQHNFEDNSGYEGVGDLTDDAWSVRLLAIRDLVRLGSEAVSTIEKGMHDENRHVRHVCVTALGILGDKEAGEDLIGLLRNDPDPVVRGQAAQTLGQLGFRQALPVLKLAAKQDESMHVKHRAMLAIGQIDSEARTGSDQIETWANLDEKKFRLAKVGKPAPDFELKDTSGKTWRLSDFKNKKTVMLVWIFADWCPVCHREFHDLIQTEDQFVEADVQVFTVECHDLYRCRVMAGNSDIWETFLKEWAPKSLSDIAESVSLRNELWWPHLVDTAGAVGAMYGVDPMEFIVHDEWINRPSTIIIDPEGIIRLAYYGTYWGDRPTIEESLEMIKTNSYTFHHPQRRE